MQTGSLQASDAAPQETPQVWAFKTTTNVLEEKAGTWNTRGSVSRGGWTAAISPQSPELPASGCPGQELPTQPAKPPGAPGPLSLRGPGVLSEKQAGCRGPGPGEEVQREKGVARVHSPHLGQAGPGMQSLHAILWSHPGISRVLAAAMRV